jgi:hypothetical protein
MKCSPQFAKGFQALPQLLVGIELVGKHLYDLLAGWQIPAEKWRFNSDTQPHGRLPSLIFGNTTSTTALPTTSAANACMDISSNAAFTRRRWCVSFGKSTWIILLPPSLDNKLRRTRPVLFYSHLPHSMMPSFRHRVIHRAGSDEW